MIGLPYSPATYSLAARCGSEMLATCFAIYIGEAAVANELLKRTKGNGYGWGFLSFGFGFPFGVVTMMFGHVSAVLNPAMLLTQVVLGNLGAGEYFALSASELVGAFFGAILMWLTFLPHFNIVPEAPALHGTSAFQLLQGTRGVGENVLNAASYNDDPVDQFRRRHPVRSLQQTLGDMRAFLKTQATALEEQERTLDEVIATADSARREEVRETVESMKRTLAEQRNESLNQLNRLDTHGVDGDSSHGGSPPTDRALEPSPFVATSPRAGNVPQRPPAPRLPSTLPSSPVSPAPPTEGRGGTTPARGSLSDKVRHMVMDAPHLTARHNRGPKLKGVDLECKTAAQTVDVERERAIAKYRAEVALDQNCKLGIFSTRPAIYAPFFNFLCEFLCTATLALTANLMGMRADQLFAPERALFNSIFGMWIGFLIFLLVLTIGGPTGIAANPARDLGPRIAHWLLPIPGKGPSEFITYGWIPVFATLAGGAAGGGILRAILLFTSASNVSPTADLSCQVV